MLINVVRQNQNKTNQEIIDFLNQDVILKSDNTQYTIAQVKIALGNNIDAVRLVCGTIKAVVDVDPLVWAFGQKLFSTGISFSDAETQTIIMQLAHPSVGNWPDAVRDAVLAIGIVRGKKWQELGLNKLPDSVEINNARTEITRMDEVVNVMNSLVDLLQNVSSFVGQTNNEILAPAINYWKTLDEVKSSIDVTKLDEFINTINDIKQILT